jgi:Trypsin-like peptidase domain
MIEDALPDAVLRVQAGTDPELAGTAFAVTEHLAVTCAHVVPPHPNGWRLIGAAVDTAVVEVMVPPDPARADVALLRTADPLPVVLPCAASDDLPKTLVSRGYLPSDVGSGGHELAFETRNRTRAAYGDYVIDGAYDLAGDVADKGLSGSPLADPRSGAVIGFVSSGFARIQRSYAIPFAISRWEPLLRALRENGAVSARYGNLVNLRGALDLCTTQVRYAVAQRQRIGKFDRDWDVARPAAKRTVEQFLDGAYPVLAFVGPTNVGKTWLFCGLATGLQRPCVLLSPTELPLDRGTGFDAFLVQSLRAAWTAARGERAPDVPAADVLARACSEKPLVVLLDAVNEAIKLPRAGPAWLADAVDWCVTNGVRLIMSSRPESWPAIEQAIPRSADRFYSPDAGPTERDGRFAQIGDFSAEEAANAARAYGIELDITHEIGRHPLLFRVARELRITAAEAALGRFRLLDAFIDHRVNAAHAAGADALPQTLHAALRRLASAPGVDSGLEWDRAEQIAGGPALLERLIASGVVSPVGRRLRFTYDQLAEVMRPVPPDLVRAFEAVGEAGTSGGHTARAAAIGLLRAEADGDDETFRAAFGALLGLVSRADENGIRVVGDAFLDVARALPAARASERGALLDALCASAVRAGSHRLAWQIAEAIGGLAAPGEAARRLVALLPLETSYELRWKDWADPSRRFNSLDRVFRTARIALALDRLHAAAVSDVRPVLVEALADTSPLDGHRGRKTSEATISSVAGALLFHRRGTNARLLLDLLFERNEERGGVRRFLSVLIQDEAETVLPYLIDRFRKDSQNLSYVRTALELFHEGSAHLSPSQTRRVVRTSRPLLHADPETATLAALLLRRLNPQDAEAWDVLAEHATRYMGSALGTIPAGRFDAACALARRRPELGLGMMIGYDGPLEGQSAFAAEAHELLQRRAAPTASFGALAERKLERFAEDERYAPWLPFARSVMELDEEDGVAREIVLGTVFDRQIFVSPRLREFAFELAASALSDDERSSAAANLWHNFSSSPEAPGLLDVLRALRAPAPLVVDRAVYARACDLGDSDERRTMRAQIVELWESLGSDEHTAVSRRVIDALRAGRAPSRVFPQRSFLRR